MRELEANTQVKVRIGPVVDVTDAVTPVTTLNLGTADEAELLKHDGAATVDISGNTFAAVTGSDGWYDLTLTAGNLDTEGDLTVVIQDDNVCMPVYAHFEVVSQAYYQSKYGAKDTGYMDVNVKAISEDTAAADALEAQFDGTGLSGDTYPATQAQVGNLSTGSASISTTVSSTEAVLPAVVGTPTNTYTATYEEDGTYHSWAPSGGTLEFAYNFNIGANASPTIITWIGYCQGNNDTIGVYARNWVAGTWEQIGTIDGTALATQQTRVLDLTTSHVNTGANAGDVRIRFYSTGGPVVTTFATDRMLCSYTITNQSVGYAMGAIWVDTNASNTNTVAFVDGVADNPVSTWAAALTLSASTGINNFQVAGGSSITLSANSDNYSIHGDGLFTLALGNQSIANTHIHQATISGVGSGSGAIMEDCRISADTSLGPCYVVRSGFNTPSGQPFVANGNGEYVFVDCVSLVAGSGTPYFDFSGTGASSGVNIRRWAGGTNITLDSDNTLSLEVLAGGGQTVTTGGGNVEIRGCCRSVTVTMSAAETVQFAGVTGPITLSGTTNGTVNLYGVSASLTDNTSNATVTDETVSNPNAADAVWDEQITNQIHNGAQSAGKRLRQLSSPVIHEGTAQGGTSTSITLDAGASAVDGTYDPSNLVISGGTGIGQSRQILEYNGSTKVAYVNRDWKVTPDATSEFVIYASVGDTHINEGAAQGGSTNTITLNSLASSVDDIYNEQTVFIVAGTGADQCRNVVDYVGSTRVATVEHDWEVTPDATSVYVMLPSGNHLLTELNAEMDTAIADASLATAASITTLRGTDNDTLKTLSDQLDGTATAAALTTLRGADNDTLKTLSDQLDGTATAAAITALRGADNDTLKTLSDQIDLLATAAAIVAMRGADNDTLKTLSDQIDAISTTMSNTNNVSRTSDVIIRK